MMAAENRFGRRAFIGAGSAALLAGASGGTRQSSNFKAIDTGAMMPQNEAKHLMAMDIVGGVRDDYMKKAGDAS